MNKLLPVVLATALVCGSASAQTVPIAEGAPDWAGLQGLDWPSDEEIGVPLYPDLKAFFTGANVGVTAEQSAFRFVNFASQADVQALLAWYEENAEGWVVDATMEMLFPKGASMNDALMGSVPYVNISDAAEGTVDGKCGGWYACKSLVQVVYKPAS